jgi:formamidopyrimidine-DNA glycosylase
MPELPEVEALALDLRGRLDGHAITVVHLAAFSALKTYDPPLSALSGLLVDDVTRHGKFLDIEASGLHVVLHLARAGWVRWKDEVPALPPRPSSKSGLAVRVVLDDDSGLDVTEAGTKKSLAMYVVRDPLEVPGIASLGPDPLTDDFTPEVLGAILEREGRKQIKGVLRHQGTIAGIGNAYSDEILHAARMSPYRPASAILEAGQLELLHTAIRTTIGDAVERSRGLAASQLKGEKKSNLAVHGQTGGKPLADRRMSKLLK